MTYWIKDFHFLYMRLAARLSCPSFAQVLPNPSSLRTIRHYDHIRAVPRGCQYRYTLLKRHKKTRHWSSTLDIRPSKDLSETSEARNRFEFTLDSKPRGRRNLPNPDNSFLADLPSIPSPPASCSAKPPASGFEVRDMSSITKTSWPLPH